MALKRYDEWKLEATSQSGVEFQQLIDVIDTASVVNSYTLEDWENIPGVGSKLAKRLLENGPYSSLEQLKEVKGVGDKMYERIAEHVYSEV